MSIDDAAHARARLQPREAAVDELYHRGNEMRMRRYGEGIRKCMNTKAQPDEVRCHRVETDQIELKVRNETKRRQKARETRTVRSE